MNAQDRVAAYNAAFPKFPNIFFDKGWILGVWNIGNSYKGSGYYGSYPPSYMKRIMSMFPDKKKILHLFSGSLGPDANGITFDINPKLNPMVVGDAHYLTQFFNQEFDLILSDCPYSKADAVHYGYPMINRFKVVKECVKVMQKGAHLAWMDTVLPMYRKEELARVGEIMITRSTNHRVRAVFLFEKK
jgi:hypothetical protein